MQIPRYKPKEKRSNFNEASSITRGAPCLARQCLDGTPCCDKRCSLPVLSNCKVVGGLWEAPAVKEIHQVHVDNGTAPRDRDGTINITLKTTTHQQTLVVKRERPTWRHCRIEVKVPGISSFWHIFCHISRLHTRVPMRRSYLSPIQ